MGLSTGLLLAGGKFVNDALKLTGPGTISAMAADAVLCGAATYAVGYTAETYFKQDGQMSKQAESGFQGAVPSGQTEDDGEPAQSEGRSEGLTGHGGGFLRAAGAGRCWLRRRGSLWGWVGVPFVRLMFVLTVSRPPAWHQRPRPAMSRRINSARLVLAGVPSGFSSGLSMPCFRRTCAPACRIGSVMMFDEPRRARSIRVIPSRSASPAASPISLKACRNLFLGSSC